ncbi:MAG TPA: L-threonylcarbamoyladenylate synthase [Galbitalea sp.]|jgi:tRNA threonylcarbamoyl adenosine modification protein (Sua5/YciO/YrdC/YwlC family)|nr:L-threonylcarbamoyladenylate synthase [Galbitalea sp.]
MAPEFDCSDPSELVTGVRLARAAIDRGELVVIPTDTVYGIAADAFSPAAVKGLLQAKGRGRESPPPVLIPGVSTLDALAEDVPDEVRALVAKFWPGGLTVILPARSSLSWDLGEARGTVALRMPANDIALKVLAETGPLAVSSANLTGKPAASTNAEARAYFGDSVSVYLDGGTVGAEHGRASDPASTIVDATALSASARSGAAVGKLRIVRHGVISDDAIREVVGADRCE